MPPIKSFGNNQPHDAVFAGQIALEESRYLDAADHFRTALKLGGRSAEEEAFIRCQLSEALEKRGLYPESLSAISKYDNFPSFVHLSERTQMMILVRLGWAYSFINEIPRAIALFNQAISIARRLKDDSGMGACYFGLGRAYRNLNEIRIASDHYTSGLEHYRRVGDWRKLAESYINLGQMAALEGDYRSTLHSLGQALAIMGDHEEHNLRGRAYMYQAVSFDRIGLTNKALDAWDRCIEHFSRASNTPFVAMNYNNLADKLIDLGDWARAEELLKSALEMMRQSSMVANRGGILDTLAQLYVLLGRIEEADRLLEESRQMLSSIKTGEWAEVSTMITMGRSHLVKRQVDPAIRVLERAVEVCERSGDHHYLAEAKLWLAEARLMRGEIGGARAIIESARAYLTQTAQMKWWGGLMRMSAKIEATEGHIAAAIQTLGQSTSIFEIKGNVYAVAINHVLNARLIEKQGRTPEAIAEVRAALVTLERLGATIDEADAREALARLEGAETPSPATTVDSGRLDPDGTPRDVVYTSASLYLNMGERAAEQEQTATAQDAEPNLASAIDGFITRRMVQASVTRELLLYELASIARERSASRAAVVAEGEGANLKLTASVGLEEKEKGAVIEFLSKAQPEAYEEHFIYPFRDNRNTQFLLYLIGPSAERFSSGRVNLQPMLLLVELGLEAESHRSKNRRPQVFDTSRFLSQVELPGFICASRAMSLVLEQIHKIRSSDVTVLITGESGTGKELIARAVHAGSSRRFNAFIPFNCSAAPREMIESQLFGFRKGAFTGAVANNEGIIRGAERGTLFLDEIGDLPLELQPKLLRFLQEGEIHPIGESQPLHVDVRVVAATNSDLERAVSEGRFREDLFHRLNVIRIQVPPLRERREEIPALINFFLNQYQLSAAKSEIKVSEEAVDLMVVYDWPGNVRQLSNEVRRIVAYSESNAIVTQEMLSPEIARAVHELEPAPASKKVSAPQIVPDTNKTLAEAVDEVERQMIQEALRRTSNNIARAAKELGLTRRGLYLKMDRLLFKE